MAPAGCIQRHQGGRGFSLIELLVVMGSIAVLAGMLLPTVQAVRRQARRTQCAGSMAQWYLAITAWSADRHGLVPASNTYAGGQNPSHIWVPDQGNHELDLETMSAYMDARVVVSSSPITSSTTVRFSSDMCCPYWKPLQANVYAASPTWWYTLPGYQYYGQFVASPQTAYTRDRFLPDRLLMTDWAYYYIGPNLPRQTHSEGQNQLFGDGTVTWRPYSPAEAATIPVGGTACPSVVVSSCRFYR